MSQHYGEQMDAHAAEVAKDLMATIALFMSSEAKEKIETALRVAFLKGAMQGRTDLMDKVKDAFAKVGEVSNGR